METRQKKVEYVAQSAEDRLQLLLHALQDLDAQGLPIEMWTSIVISLGAIHPPTNPNNYKQFISNVESVQEILRKECMKHYLTFDILKAMYNEISTSDKPLSPAMSIVLQLIDVRAAVNLILRLHFPPEGLKRALQNLCIWLTKWTWTENLGLLVYIFMQCLEAQQHCFILYQVTIATIEPLFKLWILPEHRKSVGPIVCLMLSQAQDNPDVFHKIIPHVNSVVTYLCKEKSESSLSYLREIAIVCMHLMEHFPEYSNLYGTLKKELEPYLPAIKNWKRTFTEKAWLYENSWIKDLYYSSRKVGLDNLGNTCYMNSALQALFMTKPFRNKILQHNKAKTSLLAKLQNLFSLLQDSKSSSLSPYDISNLAILHGFLLGHQHDSSEFLSYLLDILHGEEKTAVCTNDSKTGCSTIVQSTFGGRLVSTSRCRRCGTRNRSEDNFRVLQLSFPSNSDKQSVQTLIHYNFYHTQKLSGDNQYQCDVCDCLTGGIRVTHIEETPPPCLILTLKRFWYDHASQQHMKQLQIVKLDYNVLLEVEEYELYAVVVHDGPSVDSGHYYTFAKDGEEWFKLNDCSVTRTMFEELCNLKPLETPYILFYRRLDFIYIDLEKDGSLTTREQNGNDEPPPPGCSGAGFSM